MSQFFRPFLSVFILSIVFVVICCLSAPVFAQKPTWRYVQTIYGGAKIYLNDEVKILPDKHRVVWDQRRNSDNSFAISKVEWDCAGKQNLTLEMTMYDSAQTVLGTVHKFEWQSVVPGSAADAMLRQMCFDRPPDKFVEVIAADASFYKFPDAAAIILRTAKKGSRFVLIQNTGQGGWYNVVNEKTQQDYWVDGNDIKIVEAAAEVQKAAEKKQQRQRARRFNRKGNKRR